MTEQAISISEYAEETGLSKNQIYARIASGKIVAIKDGTLKIFSKATLEHQLACAQEEAQLKAEKHQPRKRGRREKATIKQKKIRLIHSKPSSSFKESLVALRKGG